MIKILFLAANPKDTEKLRLDEEVRSIQEKLYLSQYGARFKLEQGWAVKSNSEKIVRLSDKIIHMDKKRRRRSVSDLIFAQISRDS